MQAITSAPTVLPHISSPVFEERLREAVASRVVPDATVLRHVKDSAERALAVHLNPFRHPVDYANAAQALRLAADLCQHLATKAGAR
jgi:hypothetical protein